MDKYLLCLLLVFPTMFCDKLNGFLLLGTLREHHWYLKILYLWIVIRFLRSLRLDLLSLTHGSFPWLLCLYSRRNSTSLLKPIHERHKSSQRWLKCRETKYMWTKSSHITFLYWLDRKYMIICIVSLGPRIWSFFSTEQKELLWVLA